MNDQGEDKEKGQKQWLKEHETIQVDLLKMKDELLSELDGQGPGPAPGSKPVQRKEGGPPPNVPERPPPREPAQTKPPQEMTIKQMLGGIEQAPKKEMKDRGSKEPQKLEEGKIPTSPDLTSKIANVLQLEDKLKRRKFELEKRARGKDVPPPPTRPVMKEEIVVEEVEDDTLEEAHEIELIRYTPEEEEEEDQFEEVDELESTTEGVEEIKSKGKSEKKGSSEPESEEKEGKDKTSKEGAPKRNHHEERKKKRRGIWALFGRG
ncbi:MAG: hypothetical protein ACMUHM_02985 [Thermoplasmatota archaeon]